MKGPTHMVEGDHQARNIPLTLGTTSVDFYHYPMMVWTYPTPQPNTEVPALTGGYQEYKIIWDSAFLIYPAVNVNCKTKSSWSIKNAL